MRCWPCEKRKLCVDRGDPRQSSKTQGILQCKSVHCADGLKSDSVQGVQEVVDGRGHARMARKQLQADSAGTTEHAFAPIRTYSTLLKAKCSSFVPYMQATWGRWAVQKQRKILCVVIASFFQLHSTRPCSMVAADVGDELPTPGIFRDGYRNVLGQLS